MLSIVVNDALIGVDVVKKYPTFYSRMLVDRELRTAFLDTLELLEQSRAGQLPEYQEPDVINLAFLHQLDPRPLIQKISGDKLELVWPRTVIQLQGIFDAVSFRPAEGYSSNALFMDESSINLVHSHLEIDEQELETRLNAVPADSSSRILNLILSVFISEGVVPEFEASIIWGDYRHAVKLDEFGLAKFPPLKVNQILASSGEVRYDLEFCLKQVN